MNSFSRSAQRDVNNFLRRSIGWGRALLAVGVVAVLLCLVIANVLRSTWNEVEDGVLWMERAGGLVAAEVAPETAAAVSGIEAGDILLSIDGVSIGSRAALVEILHSSREGTVRDYLVLRVGSQQLYELSLLFVPRRELRLYPFLVGIGIFSLLIGTSVRLRRPDNQATLHFFWLTVVFFGVFAFSYSGRLDTLDWVFYWADEVSMLLLAPLFMHFALVFPARAPNLFRQRLGRWAFGLIYCPALALGLTEVILLMESVASERLTRSVELIWQLQIAYLAACVIGGLAIMIFALQRVPSVTARRQLRWIVSGAVMGGLPFALGYALPWALGFEPKGMHLTAILLGLIPLAFASAIVRYRLRDVEVIVKRALVYTSVVLAMAGIYLVLERLASLVFLQGSSQYNSVIALLATAVVVLLARPLRDAIQAMLDRVYYRDRYDYRRALVGFARDLNSDLDLSRLTKRLVARVTETLVIDKMVLMQVASDGNQLTGAFDPVQWTGFKVKPPVLSGESSVASWLRGHRKIALDYSAVDERLSSDEVQFWRGQGIDYFVPCISEEETIAIMALGRKGSGEPLSSEDMALLAAVAGQVATALENGRLYDKLRQKATELERMHQFSQDIIESLSDGLVALGLDGRVTRWNAGLERIYGVPRGVAIGETIETLFDPPVVDRFRQAVAETPAVSYRVPLLSRHTKERRRLLVNLATAPLLSSSGGTSGMVAIIEDITERVRLEEQLQISEKMAAVGLLAAGVAHEVNTPLTGISSFTQLLLDGANPDDPTTGVLKKIEIQTFRAAKIVNGLLNLARPGRSDTTGPVDINGVINEVLVLLEPQLAAGSVQVRREMSGSPIVVVGEEFKLQQVFLNLFLNALDSMPTGGWLSIRTDLDEHEAVVKVSDTGSGIQPEFLSRIYDPFFTTKALGKGTGLGLSVIYGVVQEHQGVIECESEPDKGTRFTLRLPVAALKMQTKRAVK